MNLNIKWGIIGCGDVTEIKSGPAFNKISHSSLHAVMRRNAEKASNYAERHHVPVWYSKVEELIADDQINAIYVATPPAFHEEFTIKALLSGKDVYVEKPMALTAEGCKRMAGAASQSGSKLSVAHYRRAMPFFIKIKELLDQQAIGQVLSVHLKMFRASQQKVNNSPENNWRLNPALSGGGLFYDLAPHQIDMMLYLIGEAEEACGISTQFKSGCVPDLISGQILLKNNVLFNGSWCFNTPEDEKADICEILGSKGKITFPFFGESFSLKTELNEEYFHIPPPAHVQQPMIERVVKYFLNEAPNPCDAGTGTEVLRIMEAFSGMIPKTSN